jgi:hypothetical protein
MLASYLILLAVGHLSTGFPPVIGVFFAAHSKSGVRFGTGTNLTIVLYLVGGKSVET